MAPRLFGYLTHPLPWAVIHHPGPHWKWPVQRSCGLCCFLIKPTNPQSISSYILFVTSCISPSLLERRHSFRRELFLRYAIVPPTFNFFFQRFDTTFPITRFTRINYHIAFPSTKTKQCLTWNMPEWVLVISSTIVVDYHIKIVTENKYFIQTLALPGLDLG